MTIVYNFKVRLVVDNINMPTGKIPAEIKSAFKSLY